MGSLTVRQKSILSDISLLLVAALWGGGFVAIKDTLNTMTPMVMMAIRFSLAAVIIYAILFKWIGKLSFSEIKKGSVVGIILFMAFAVQTYGLQFTTASKQGFLTAVYVVLVPLVYWLLYRKRPEFKVFIGSGITILGIGLISLHGGFSINLGDSLTLISAVLYAMHIISIEYFAKGMSSFKLAFIQIAVAAVCFVFLALLTEPIPQGLTIRAWGAIFYMSFFSTFLCFTIQTVAQKYTTSSHAAIILSLESVFAAVFGILLLNEVMSPLMVLGCFLIFIAILLVEVNFKKNEPLS